LTYPFATLIDGEFYHFVKRMATRPACFRPERRDNRGGAVRCVDKILDWKSPQQYHVGGSTRGFNKETVSAPQTLAG
jgi:hypothetical protein